MFIIVGLTLVSISLLIVYTLHESQAPPDRIENKVRVKGFEYREPGQASCLVDQAPECGYCAGEIIDKNCYVEPKQ